MVGAGVAGVAMTAVEAKEVRAESSFGNRKMLRGRMAAMLSQFVTLVRRAMERLSTPLRLTRHRQGRKQWWRHCRSSLAETISAIPFISRATCRSISNREQSSLLPILLPAGQSGGYDHAGAETGVGGVPGFWTQPLARQPHLGRELHDISILGPGRIWGRGLSKGYGPGPTQVIPGWQTRPSV